jgi:hypothetical protein
MTQKIAPAQNGNKNLTPLRMTQKAKAARVRLTRVQRPAPVAMALCYQPITWAGITGAA